jgi:CBS domain-containing protein
MEAEMRVSEVMTSGVRMVGPEQTISEAARLMAEIDAGSLPVGEDERLIGMITDRDIAVRAVAEQKPPTTKVREIMSQEVLYCFDDQDLEDIAQNMSDVKVRRLPVVDREKRLVGIVSLGDLAKSDSAASTGQAVADITAPGGAHTQRRGSKRKNAKPV